MKVNRIYIKDWLALKPYGNHSITDNYYLNLSNEVKKVLFLEYGEALANYLDEDGINSLSCFIVSYFEDIISETNIFTTFVRKHQELYAKKLPFFDTSHYFENEINTQDVQFLVWYFLNTVQDLKFISPNKELFYKIALDVMIILEEAYEYAPENNLLKSYYILPNNETDFYKCREMIDLILFKTYLFNTDTNNTLLEKETAIIEDLKNDEHLVSYLRDNRDALIYSEHTKLLGLKGNEWYAEIIGEKHALYTSFLNISPKIKGYFFYKGQDATSVFIEHIASSKKFSVTKKSLDHAHTLTEVDAILFMGIALWQEEWWFSGVFIMQDFNADLVLDEKNAIESRKMVDFLDHDKNLSGDILENQHQVFLDFNHGKQIAFIPANKVEEFSNKYIEYFNKSLNLSKKEMQKAQNRLKKEGFFGGNDKEQKAFNPDFESALVFFNPKSGLEIAFDVNSAFPFKENMYFNEEKVQEHIFRLFMTEEISTELVLFCIANFKDKSPYFQTAQTQFLLKELDFLLRFFKGSQYHSKPQITLIGKQE